MNELKPCPFCGGGAVIHHCGELENETMAVVFGSKVGIHCRNCHIATMPYETKNEAIEAWNRRAENG